MLLGVTRSLATGVPGSPVVWAALKASSSCAVDAEIHCWDG
jgi:hypothetical protein